MDWADLTNALFELGGALLNWMNVRRLWRDRDVKGVWWPAWAFFAAWGWWNVYFYGPHLGQWMSWGAGIVMVVSNTVWVALAVYFLYLARVRVRVGRARRPKWAFRRVGLVDDDTLEHTGVLATLTLWRWIVYFILEDKEVQA